MVNLSITYSIHSGFLILKLMRMDKRCVCARVLEYLFASRVFLVPCHAVPCWPPSCKCDEIVSQNLPAACIICPICIHIIMFIVYCLSMCYYHRCVFIKFAQDFPLLLFTLLHSVLGTYQPSFRMKSKKKKKKTKKSIGKNAKIKGINSNGRNIYLIT